MKILQPLLISALLALPSVASAAPEQGGLAAKAKAAFADITKAKTALDAGKTKTSDGWLAKTEALLKSAMGKKEGGEALAKTDEAAGAAQQGDAPKTQTALSQAEGAAEKIDPAIAGKLGFAKEQSAQGDTGGASNTVDEAKQAIADKTGLGGLYDTYQKVTMARSLLKGGDSGKAKGILDQIPSSPADLLKGL
jgi:thioredoxin-like negative regulator of GroEL